MSTAHVTAVTACVIVCCAWKSATLLHVLFFGGGEAVPLHCFSVDKMDLLLQLLQWFPLFQNSMIPTGLAWEDMLYPLYQKYKNAITWGDQDLLNIIFYFNPGRLFFQNVICILVYHPPQLIEALQSGLLRAPAMLHPPAGSGAGGGCWDFLEVGLCAADTKTEW